MDDWFVLAIVLFVYLLITVLALILFCSRVLSYLWPDAVLHHFSSCWIVTDDVCTDAVLYLLSLPSSWIRFIWILSFIRIELFEQSFLCLISFYYFISIHVIDLPETEFAMGIIRPKQHDAYNTYTMTSNIFLAFYTSLLFSKWNCFRYFLMFKKGLKTPKG